MSVKTIQIDPLNSTPARLNKSGYARTTQQFYEKSFKLHKYFVNSFNSSNFAINGTIAAGGGVTNIWDGTGVGDTGTLDWVPSSNGAVPPLETPLAMQSGTNGLDVQLLAGDRLFFNTLTPTDMSLSQSISFWIQPQVGYVAGPQMRTELRYLGKRQGGRVDAEMYMGIPTVGVWQQVVIPIADFGNVGLVDEIRIQARNVDKFFFIDGVMHGSIVGPTSDPLFTFYPVKDYTNAIESVNITLTGTSQVGGGSWDISDFGNGLPLVSSLLLRVIQQNTVTNVFNFLNNGDLVEHSSNLKSVVGPTITTQSYDINMGNILMHLERGDRMEIIARADLTALLSAKASARGIYFDDE